jgi:hypothetical protein
LAFLHDVEGVHSGERFHSCEVLFCRSVNGIELVSSKVGAIVRHAHSQVIHSGELLLVGGTGMQDDRDLDAFVRTQFAGDAGSGERKTFASTKRNVVIAFRHRMNLPVTAL